jgi:peptide/nickel transport system substrate-binding protein
VAALKAGDIDMMYEVPPADTETLKKDANITVLEGPETRVVYLGMDQERDELLESTSRARTRSRTSASARSSIARSTSTRSSAP